MCGSCVRVRRPCRYTYGKFSHFVYQSNGGLVPSPPDHPNGDSSSERTTRTNTPDDIISTPLAILSLRSSYAAESGHGLFQKFASKPTDRKKMMAMTKGNDHSEQQNKNPPPRPPHIPRQPISDQMNLVSRFLTLTTHGHTRRSNSPLDMFGDLQRWIPKLIGSSEVVAATTRSLLDSLMTYTHRNSTTLAMSRRSNGLALQVIRCALQDGPHATPPTSDILLSIRMMYLIEVKFLSLVSALPPLSSN